MRPHDAHRAQAAAGALDAYRGARALVLGGTGFIGAWIVRALQRCEAIVTVTARDDDAAAAAPGGATPSAITIVRADFADQDAIARVLARVRPQIVFNLAGYGVDPSERDPALMTAINASLVGALCAQMASMDAGGWDGASVVQAGSALEYGPVEGTISEACPPNPTTDYGRTKLQATQIIQAQAAGTRLRAVVGRLFTVYGPGEHPHRLLPALLRVARTGRSLALTDGRQPRDFTYVEDVAEGLLRLGVSAAPAGTVVNLATSRLATVREFAETAASVLGFDAALLEFGSLPTRAEEMWHGTVDVGRLRDLVSWVPPTTIADGIRRTGEILHAV
jgi:dTDP-6-deoxy-L-talose 4-dehydrogenase (NAD+)